MTRGQDELLSEFISRLNRVGENVTHTIDFAEYNISTGSLPSSEVTISQLRVQSTGNLLTSAVKTVDMKADCQCIQGSIDKVDKIDLIFDYQIGDVEGAAEVTLYDFQAMYNMTPEVKT